jgi:hypothetical protein
VLVKHDAIRDLGCISSLILKAVLVVFGRLCLLVKVGLEVYIPEGSFILRPSDFKVTILLALLIPFLWFVVALCVYGLCPCKEFRFDRIGPLGFLVAIAILWQWSWISNLFRVSDFWLGFIIIVNICRAIFHLVSLSVKNCCGCCEDRKQREAGLRELHSGKMSSVAPI